MKLTWADLAHAENFLQLNFLFTGLEVSSTAVFLARVATLLVFGAGLIWVIFKITLKTLDCLQAFLAGIGQLPRSFFLVLLLVIPLSADSIGARWMGYIVLALSLLGLGAVGVFVVVLWKYGVDQAMRLISRVRSISHPAESPTRCPAFPPDNEYRPDMDLVAPKACSSSSQA